ncbi:hypothetical protein Tco_1488035 [Tanacetum coccineum]
MLAVLSRESAVLTGELADFYDIHNMVAYLLKPEGSEDFHQIVDFLITSYIKYTLTKNPTIHVSLIQQFWQTASASTFENGEMEITTTIDGRVKTVTKASIWRHLKLEDSYGINTLPNTKFFEKLALMSPKKTSWEQFSSNIATAIICLATNRTFNFSRMIFEGMVKNLDMESLEFDLKQTKLTYGAAFTKLIMKVKRLEKKIKLNKARRRAEIVVSDDEDAKKDTSKHGRSMIEDIDQDAGVSLVSAHGEAHSQGSKPKDQLGVFSAAKILADVARVHTYFKRRMTVSTGSGGISTAKESVSTAGALMPVSTAGMDQGSIPSPSVSKDKGKAIMKESEPKQATTKLKQRQEIAGYEATIRLQE